MLPPQVGSIIQGWIRNRPIAVWVAGLCLALLALSHTAVWAQEQDKDQQRCINQVN